MPTVRAKFVVRSKEQSKYSPQSVVQTAVKLVPVMSGSEENNKFFAASPSGEIVLGIVNQAAADQLELGQEYYVDFTPANPPPAPAA